ncbi:hypothetical protein ACHAXR_011778, partial [Thalassiosira sp. AJA248-18]
MTPLSSVGLGATGRAIMRPRAVRSIGLAPPPPPTTTAYLRNNTILQLRRQRCNTCATIQSQQQRALLRPNNGMLRYHDKSNFRSRPASAPARSRQQQQRFSTKAQKPNNNNKNQTTIRTILSSSAFHNATPTQHPLLRLLLQSLQHTLLKPRSIPLPRYISPRHYSFTLSECFGHSSFILVAASYITQDFLELRILAVVGSTSMLFFTYFHPHGRVLWLPLKWNMLFIAINSWRIGKVLYDRYMADGLSDEMKVFREEHLGLVDKVDYYKLIRIAKEEVFEEGELVLHQ